MKATEEAQERVCVTMGMRVNLGNYESADASICLSGIPVGASPELIAEMLDTSQIAFGQIKRKLLDKCAELRRERNGREEFGLTGRPGGAL